MSNKALTVVGLIITIIGIVASFTVPEIRKLIGLDKKTECEKVENSILLKIEALEKGYLTLNPITLSHKDLKTFCQEINSLKQDVDVNEKCIENKLWKTKIINFLNLSHEKIAEIVTKWDMNIESQKNMLTSKDLFYQAIILDLSLTSIKLCKTNEDFCNEKLRRAFGNVLSKYKEENFIVD